MSKPLRFAPPDLPVHVWIRGNQRQDVFFTNNDRSRYLDLLGRHSLEQRVRVLAYCLMTNHVHLVLEPTCVDGLSRMMMHLNSEYAQNTQFKLGRSGHLWQGRFHSSVLDNPHLWTVFRYVELNPVRAGLVHSPETWRWSSAGVHMGLSPWPEWLEPRPFCSRFAPEEWREQLATSVTASDRAAIKKATRRNRPLASQASVEAWETQFSVLLRPRRPGRPTRKSLELTKASGA